MYQQCLPFDLETTYDEHDFLVSKCNSQAYSAITNWPNWPGHALALIGPKGCGKTHLSHIWQEKSLSGRALAKDLGHTYLMQQNFVVEDMENLTDESALFHLYNSTKEALGFLLLTSSVPLDKIKFKLADLKSRICTIPAVEIKTPDEFLMRMVLEKLLSDKQIRTKPDVIAYIMSVANKDFNSIQNIVEILDEEALRTKRNITIPFVKMILK